MTIKAVTGIWPAAAAWSTNEEERRKALLSYFMCGVPYILWDNIIYGTRITCPHIEKSCTAAFYSDRLLGVSKIIAIAASTVHILTGNNIKPHGELASRSLDIRLELDRTDPENRHFHHPDPIGWTDSHRAEILSALYTILLGNPTLRLARNAPMKTRFKVWWRLVGSAIEHAARLASEQAEPAAYADVGLPAPCAIDFQQLFLTQDDEHEDSKSLAEALAAMRYKWPASFDASEIARFINEPGSSPSDQLRSTTLREFFYPNAKSDHVASAKSVGSLLAKYVGNPVNWEDDTLILRKHHDLHIKSSRYKVEKKATKR
jgi:hypothetical protein